MVQKNNIKLLSLWNELKEKANLKDEKSYLKLTDRSKQTSKRQYFLTVHI